MPKIQILVKLVVFSVIGEKLKILLHDGLLPYHFLGQKVSLDEAAKRIFNEYLEISLDDSYIEQLYTFSHLKEETTEIVVVYYILLPDYIIPHETQGWKDIYEISKNICDRQIIKYALQRLRWKIEYTNVVYSLLPAEFTFSELQKTYEAILDRSLDKRNFRKKILSLNLVRSTRHQKKLGCARPALMYTFRKRELVMAKIFS